MCRALLPLLDPVGDREEIRALQTKVLTLERLPVPITPIVVDLGGTGQVSRLIARDATVHFDLDGRGAPRQWEWITPEAAWLAWDPQHTGRITSGTQLFGSVTFLMFWRTGYDALTVLDDDSDGWLRGNELRGLVLWHDADSDGVSDAGEVTGPRVRARAAAVSSPWRHRESCTGTAAWGPPSTSCCIRPLCASRPAEARPRRRSRRRRSGTAVRRPNWRPSHPHPRREVRRS